MSVFALHHVFVLFIVFFSRNQAVSFLVWIVLHFSLRDILKSCGIVFAHCWRPYSDLYVLNSYDIILFERVVSMTIKSRIYNMFHFIALELSANLFWVWQNIEFFSTNCRCCRMKLTPYCSTAIFHITMLIIGMSRSKIYSRLRHVDQLWIEMAVMHAWHDTLTFVSFRFTQSRYSLEFYDSFSYCLFCFFISILQDMNIGKQLSL